MDRLLALLFSMVLLTATAPSREFGMMGNGGCMLETICGSESGAPMPCSPDGGDDDCGQQSSSTLPRCCVCGPCCCLCLIPERAEFSLAALPEEKSVQPATQRVFVPQSVGRAIWKPPAFAV